MKNTWIHSYFGMALTAVLIGGGGCQDPSDEFELLVIESEAVSLKEGMLNFQNAQIFENYMLGVEEHPIEDGDSFVSLFSLTEEQTRSNLRVSEAEQTALAEFLDTPLLKILNQDGLVAIGGYFIRLDFAKKIAAVTKDERNVHLLRKKEYEDGSIQLYSFEDELLSILFDDDQSSSHFEDSKNHLFLSNMRIQDCSTGSPKPGLNLPYRPETTNPNPTVSRQEEWSLTSEQIEGRQYRIRAKHAYQAAAIYFRLKSELEQYSRVFDSSSIFSPLSDPFASLTYWGDFTPKKRSKRMLDGCYTQCQGCGPQPANTRKIQKIHHEAGRRLTQVNLHMIFRGRIGGSEAGANAIPFEYRLTPINR